MSAPIDDGGPAFSDDRNQVGMSLRDYFAAAALPQAVALFTKSYPNEAIADRCYNYADAMIARRKKAPQP